MVGKWNGGKARKGGGGGWRTNKKKGGRILFPFFNLFGGSCLLGSWLVARGYFLSLTISLFILYNLSPSYLSRSLSLSLRVWVWVWVCACLT